MNYARRVFLTSLAPAAFVAAATAAAQLPGQLPPPSRRPSPFPPDNGPAPTPNPRAILKENQKEIQEDVKKLYQLATELKQQVSKTDSAEVLSLELVRKAEEIEKLARQIKNLARAA